MTAGLEGATIADRVPVALGNLGASAIPAQRSLRSRRIDERNTPRGTLQTDFTTAEAGQTAYYALRWLSTRGQTGPWSEIAAATA